MLLEFFADLYSESTLLPKDPVLRARTRFFIDAVGTKLIPSSYSFVYRGADDGADATLKGLEAIQDLLPADKTFAVSNEFTIADAAVAPFLARTAVAAKYDVGAFKVGEGKKVHEVLESKRFNKLRKYFTAVKERDSFKNTFDEVCAILRE